MHPTKLPSIILAFALQLLPITRVFVATSPATGSSFAIVSTWIAGIAALLGSYNAVSGASTTITSAATATGTNGFAFSYRITAGPMAAHWFSAAPLPSGLACDSATGRITGTPTQSGSFSVILTATDGSNDPERRTTKNLALTIVSLNNPPSIVTPSGSRTATNGGVTTFTVVANGASPLAYQWRTNGVDITGATSSTLTLSPVTTNHAGSYTVVITNSLGSITSSVAVLTVLVPPSISSQPTSQTVTVGGNASFTVAADGTAPLTYQWRRAGTNLAGATSATLNLNAVTTGQAGSYTVVVANSAGSVTSTVATLTVLSPPSITTQPASRTSTNGGVTTFTVVATGTPTPAYQWRTNDVDITGATSSTLTLSPATTNHAGNYSVVITNSLGSITSSVAVLTVLVPPSISSQPASQTVTAGEDVNFAVVADGTAPLAYQWKRNGANIVGETSETLNLTLVSVGQAGSYTVVVANSAGSVTSVVATLTVNAPPIPDTLKPTLAVSSPSAALTRVPTNSINLVGTAHDNQGLASVRIQRDNQGFLAASGLSNWVSTFTLIPGTNHFRIWAVDTSGNVSVTNTRTVVYVVSLPLLLTKTGYGTLTGPTNGQLLELGKAFTLKATPLTGNLLSNWTRSSSVLTNGPTLSFVMASNLALTANFVTNPFIGLKGAYSGLFYPNTPEPAHEHSGFFTVSVTDKATYSGSLLLAGMKHSFSGKLDLDLAGFKTIVRNGTNELFVGIRLVSGSDQVSGYVSNAFWTSDLFGYRATYHAKTRPATNQLGKYTTLLSGGDDAANGPLGEGFATLAITTAGAVAIKGSLADGSALAQKTTMAGNGQTPVYVNLYKSKGSFFGWLNITNTATNDIPGLLLWTKKAGVVGNYCAAGFTNEVRSLGSRYQAPAAATAGVGLSDALLLLEGGNLTQVATNLAHLSALNKITFTGTNVAKLTLTLNPASGLLTGSFLNPQTLKSTLIKGVVLQRQVCGGGFFLGTNHTGAVYLGLEQDYPIFAP